MIINHGYAQPISASYGVYDYNTTRSRELEIENYLKKFASNEIYYLDLETIINNLKILISLQRDFYDRFYFDNIQRTHRFHDDNSFLTFINKALSQYLDQVLVNFDYLSTINSKSASQYLEKNISLFFELTNSQSSPIAKLGLQHQPIYSFDNQGNQVEIAFFSKKQNDNLLKLTNRRPRIARKSYNHKSLNNSEQSRNSSYQNQLNFPDTVQNMQQLGRQEIKSEIVSLDYKLISQDDRELIEEDKLKPFSCQELFIDSKDGDNKEIADDKKVIDKYLEDQTELIDSSSINKGSNDDSDPDHREVNDVYGQTHREHYSSENEGGGLEITTSPSYQSIYDGNLESHVDESAIDRKGSNWFVERGVEGIVASPIHPELIEMRLLSDGEPIRYPTLKNPNIKQLFSNKDSNAKDSI